MFNDPQVVNIDGADLNFNRIGSSDPSKKGVYETADGSHTITINQYKSVKRFRREIRLETSKVITDPISGLKKDLSSSVIFTVDEPVYGYTDAELQVLINAVLTFAGVSTNVDQLLGGEF